MKKIFIITLFFSLFLIYENIFACKCLQNDFESEFKNKEIIFSAKVKNISNSSEFLNKITFENIKSYKGEPKNLNFLTANISSACGFNFEKSKDYLVFANKINDSEDVNINICSRTKKISDSKKDYLKLETKSLSLEKNIKTKVNNILFIYKKNINKLEKKEKISKLEEVLENINKFLEKNYFDTNKIVDKNKFLIIDYLEKEIKNILENSQIKNSENVLNCDETDILNQCKK